MASPSLFSSEWFASESQWYVVCDTMFGRNGLNQDISRALELASRLQHPQARWLTELFAEKNVKTREEAKEVFLSLIMKEENNALALFFASQLSNPTDAAGIRRAADLGHPFAQVWVALKRRDDMGREELFSIAYRNASKGDREACFFLGFAYKAGVGCVKDVEKAKDNYLIASKLGNVDAMSIYGDLLSHRSELQQRWYWWSLAAKRGKFKHFQSNFVMLVKQFNSDSSLAPIVFLIGRALKGNIVEERKEIFGQHSDKCCNMEDVFELIVVKDSIMTYANQAVNFFLFQCAAARRAVDMWSLLAIRINSKVNRDIRKKIGMLIWEARELSEYKAVTAE